jgi:mono/diheme cytochrome c family protein
MQKYIVALFYRIGTKLHSWVGLAVLLLIVFLLVRSTTWLDQAYYKFIDNDPLRGASTVSADIFGDKFEKVVYLQQGWTPVDSLWFYNTTQGSDLMPYDFFIALEQEKSTEPFRSPENMNRYRYLPQKATHGNPDALPVGMVADTYRGKKYMGFTCAACHSSQVNYNGVGIRIDGGPGAADMDSFMHGLEASLVATRDDDAKRDRFITAVLAKKNYKNAAEVKEDLKTYVLRIQSYNFFNKSTSPYGYARLDAFGRIYNRVLEHVMNPQTLREILTRVVPPEKTNELLEHLKPVLNAESRDRLLERLAKLDEPIPSRLRDVAFPSPNAPVSYPFLWDIPQHDYVQWNGIGANAGVGPIGRNTGEVIGVFATLDWAQKPGWSIFSAIGGQGFGPTYIDFNSSVNLHNLRQLEDRLVLLQSPLWSDAVDKANLPPIDVQRHKRGEPLFNKYCVSCHAEIDRTSESRRVVAHMNSTEVMGTDPTMADNSVTSMGYSGILRNLYSNAGVGSVLLDTRAPVAAILTTATTNVVATPNGEKWVFTRVADWAVELIGGYSDNQIRASVKSGDYTPDTTKGPYDSLRSYKGRSLNGIWATAPYLHNGSVPTLYDLLLPASPQANDPAGTTYRPKTFRVGSRELDPKKVGFKHGVNEYAGFLFDTTLASNSNAGHEYGTREMSDQERWDLVEYLKSL